VLAEQILDLVVVVVDRLIMPHTLILAALVDQE
jgi:hypothetical protein